MKNETIHRIKNKTGNFTIILNEVFQRTDLSARAKGLYGYIMTLPDDWIIRKEEIYRHFTEGRDALDKAFIELLKAGYIVSMIDRNDMGRIVSKTFHFFETAQKTNEPSTHNTENQLNGVEVEKNTITLKKPFMGNQLLENHLMDNPQLLNTDSTNNVKQNTDSTKERESTLSISQKFEKPTLPEVKAYCKERQNSIDPERFFNFYESKGWMVGRNKMKDWKAAVRGWELTEAKKKEKHIPSWNKKKSLAGLDSWP